MEHPPEILFLPHFKAVPASNGFTRSEVCPLVQGETYTLQTTFRPELNELRKKGIKILAPLIDLKDGLPSAKGPLVRTAMDLGISRREAESAFRNALSRQTNCLAEM